VPAVAVAVIATAGGVLLWDDPSQEGVASNGAVQAPVPAAPTVAEPVESPRPTEPARSLATVEEQTPGGSPEIAIADPVAESVPRATPAPELGPTPSSPDEGQGVAGATAEETEPSESDRSVGALTTSENLAQPVLPQTSAVPQTEEAVEEQRANTAPQPQAMVTDTADVQETTQDLAADESPQPVSEDTAADDQQLGLEDRLGPLVARARQQMAGQRYTTPAGDSAFATYQQMLQISPDHQGALDGIAAIKAQYMEWGEDAITREQWGRAKRNFTKVLKIDPEDPAALAAVGRLEKSRAQQRARREQQKLEEAARVNEHDLPAESTVEIIAEQEQLLIRANDQFAANHLTRPRGDSAWDLLVRVLSIDSENRQARAGLSAIIERIEANARQKYSEGKLRASLQIAQEGLRVFPGHTGLQALQQDIQRQLEQARPERLADPPASEQPADADDSEAQIKVFGTF
ncbi:MAG: hypothetical protein ACR2RB_02030, partial [Gammaproteobacteria bacterium]